MKLKNLLILVGIVPVLCGCPTCKVTEMIDVGAIPDSLYVIVPYQKDSVYQLVHSNGYVVDFTTSRKNEISFSWNEFGCAPDYKYYQNITNLVSSYPPITIQLIVEKYDSVHASFTILAPNSAFGNLPVDTFFTESPGDSMLINSKYYQNVLVLRNHDTYNNSMLFADSIYYNKQHGLLKLFMHNGENYAIYP